MFSRLARFAAASAAALGLVFGLSAAASASTSTTSPWTAVTSLTNRPDSGYSTQPGGGNNWAVDTLTRTATLVNDGSVGDGEYQYTLTLSDVGTYQTDKGALSPNAGVLIANGQQSGPASGGGQFSFEVNAASPNSTPPQTQDGAGTPSYEWPTLFFTGTDVITYNGVFGDEGAWSYTYTDAFSCEKWVDASNVSQSKSGDITGHGNCNVTITDPGSQATQVNTAATPVPIQAATTSSNPALTYGATGLPAGLGIDSSTGVISGTPTSVENTDIVTVTATDAAGDHASTSFGWDVTAAPPPAPDSVSIRYACGYGPQRLAWWVTLAGGSNAIINQGELVGTRASHVWEFDGVASLTAPDGTYRVVTHSGYRFGIVYNVNGTPRISPWLHGPGAVLAQAVMPRSRHACP